METAPQEIKQSPFTVNDFYAELANRVSGYNARLLLQSALVETGFDFNQEENSEKQLNSDEAKNLCLELIKKGGPAFQVGKSLYSQIQ